MLRALFEWAVTFVQPDAALWYAVKNNNVDQVSAFVARNDIEAVRTALEVTDSDGLTPFLLACVNGYVQVVQALLEKDAVHDIIRNQADHHGNGPVHHACMHGRSEVVRYLVSQLGISPFLLNTSGQSPLDVTRSIYEREFGDVPKQFLECIDILEQRCTVFEGWVYESTDNIASKTLGVTALQSWKRRYCVVLRTALRTHFELVLYDFSAESRDDVNWQRSSTPTSIALFQIGADSVTFNSKQKFFNSKPFAFTLQCIRKDTSYTSLPTMLHQPIEFAAVTADGYAAWTNFLVTDALQAVYDPCMEPEAYRQVHHVKKYSPQFRAAPPSSPSPCTPTAPPLEAPDATPVAAVAPSAPVPFQVECIVCLDDPCDAVCVPCGHNTMCLACAKSIYDTTAECPVCRATIREVIKIYRA